MRRKLLAILLMFLSISLYPTSAKGVLRNIDLPPNYYWYEDIEAGNMDLIFWEFECTGDKIDLYLLEHDDFKFYQAFPFEFILEEFGEKLAGHSREASGQFRPPHSDTWYFVFLNPHSNERTAEIQYEINNFPSFYIIVPFIVVVVIAAVIIYALIFYYEKTKKTETEVGTTQAPTVQVQEQAPAEPQKERVEFCPDCGNKIMNPEAKFCDSCGFNFTEK